MAPLAVFHPAFIKDLEEDLVDVRVRFFNFVQQHHAVRAAAHGLGQHAAFTIPYVPRRRTF